MNNTTALGDYKLISPFVIQGKVKSSNTDLLTHPVVVYVIDRCVAESETHSKREIFENIDSFFGKKVLFKRKVNGYMEESPYINAHSSSAFATPELKENIRQTSAFGTRLSGVEKEDGEKLFDELSKLFENPYSINMYKGVETALMLRKTETGEESLFCLALYYDIVKNSDGIRVALDSMTEELDDDFDGETMMKTIQKEDPHFASLLEKLNLTTPADFKSLSSYALITLYAYSLGRVLGFGPAGDTTNSSLSPLEQANGIYTDLYNDLKPAYRLVADERYTVSGKKKSLQEIGEKLSLTRERIRQISESINCRLKETAVKNSYVLYEVASSALGDKSYVSAETIKDGFSNKTVYSLFIRSYNCLSLPYKYCEELDALYDSNRTDQEEIVEEESAQLPRSMSVEDYGKLSSLQKKTVLLTYRLSSKNVYIKKGVRKIDLVMDALDKNFKEGFQISDSESYAKLKEILVDDYGLSESDLPSLHSLQALIDRSDYCQIRRGTYRNIRYCVTIPDDLLNEILTYIENNPPVLFYKTIYQHFEEALANAGVDNSFYLKGLIDPKLYMLNCSYNTKRDYIQIGEKRVRSKDVMTEKIRSYEGVFTLEDLERDFPGVKDYTFVSKLYKEIDHSLIWLSGNRFVYLDKLNVDKKDIETLKSYVLSSFSEDVKSLSARRILENLKNDDPSLLERLNIPADVFSFFSLVRVVLKDELFFNRPMIYSEEDLLEKSIYDGFKKHFLSYDTFTADDIIAYFDSTYAKISANILPFFVDISKEYVQVDRRRVVRKELLYITEEDLSSVASFIDGLLLNNGVIKVEELTDFSSLPVIENQTWCPELLVGIVRSYLYDNYRVVSTTNNLRTARFRIEKI